MKKSDFFRLCRNALIRDLCREITECASIPDYDPADDEDISNLISAIHEADTEIKFYDNKPNLDTEVE